jgi:hypothetical protein
MMIAGNRLLCAQSPQFSIFDSFEKPANPGEGTVIVHQSESLRQLVGTRIDSENIDVVNGKTYLITQGYRVQVYSGNNSRTSRGEATEKQVKIKELYPDIETYVTYKAPFWILHVGDYRSFEEASHMHRNLRAAFPQDKNEIKIIEDDIRLLLN